MIRTYHALAICALLSPLPSYACRMVEIVGTAQKTKWCLTVAATPDAHRRGLQNVRELKPNTGMLFLFGRPTPQYFWMKNTPLALDILFVDASGIIRKIIKNARPYDETVLAGGCAKYVIEVPAGASQNIEIGDRANFKGLVKAAGETHGKENSNCM